MKHHTNDPICSLCEEKLKTAHEKLQAWFLDLKKEFPDVHISCAWRGKEDQEKAFHDRKTKALWPHSKHNFIQDDKPYSLALDLFQLVDGQAIFKLRYFGLINRYNRDQGHSISWGGTFRRLVDGDHFEMV